MFPKLLLLFIIVPALELYLLISIGKQIGVPTTLCIIVLTAILGASLTRAQGQRTLLRFQQAMAAGRMPHAEIMDGLMIILAGAVLLTPGFLTDAVGFALLVPPVRAVARKMLARMLKGRIQVVGGPNFESTSGAKQPSSTPKNDTFHGEKVIDAEVIDPD